MSDKDHFESINEIHALVAMIRDNEPEITVLDITNLDTISEGNMCRLAAALENNTSVQSLTCCETLTEVSARAIGEMLQNNRGLQFLVLNGNGAMGHVGFYAIMRGLAKNKTLISISLDNAMCCCGADINNVSYVLQKNSSLRHLCLGRNSLAQGRGGFAIFCTLLAKNQCLVRLELNDCQLDTFGVVLLFGMLETHRVLEHLDVSENQINDDIAESFGELLRCNMHLKSISISENNVGARTAGVVANALLNNTSLLTLEMDSNDIDDNGALAFSQNLPLMRGLRELSLEYNKMTYVGGRALIAAMKNSRTLTSLRIQGLVGPSASHFAPSMEQEIDFYSRRNEIGWRAL